LSAVNADSGRAAQPEMAESVAYKDPAGESDAMP